MPIVHKVVDTLNHPSSFPKRELESAVLMARPDFYDVLYEINPHMQGNIGTVDRNLAMKQWQTLKDTYENLGLTVHSLEGVPDLPDFVFAANQTFPFVDYNGKLRVILSKMASKHRQPEVAHFATWYSKMVLTLLHILIHRLNLKAWAMQFGIQNADYCTSDMVFERNWVRFNGPLIVYNVMLWDWNS